MQHVLDSAKALSELKAIVGDANVLEGEGTPDDLKHDECLTTPPGVPDFVVRPTTTDQVARLLRVANQYEIPVTTRGAGTGLSGGCTPKSGGMLLCLDRMKRIIEVDEANHVAVVEAGVTLAELDEATAKVGLVYPIFPGENSASLGGNVATNAGGMRAVKYGVTRNQVLGLEAVLPSGEIIRTGGKFVKVSSGYDLTQLLIGSEGTLAIVTQVTVKLFPRMPVWSTVLAPFKTLEEVAKAVPALVMSGVGPLLVEYIDRMTMMGITGFTGLELGIPEKVKDAAEAYLLVVVEGRVEEDVQRDVEALGVICGEQGAIDVFVLPSGAGTALVDAREKTFWVGKKMGLADIIDVVVPRASIPDYMTRVRAIAEKHGTMISGCGHAGDGNIHLGIFGAEGEKLRAVMHDLLHAGLDLGGAVSAEHGIGAAKRHHFAQLEDPTKLALMKGIKKVFDPNGIMNPGVLFEQVARRVDWADVEIDLDARAREIAERGYTVLEGVIEPDFVDALYEDLHRLEERLGVVPADNFFEGRKTVRIYNLLVHGALYERIPVHEHVLPLVEKVLDSGCLISSLSSIAICPEETPQPLHADDQLIPIARPHAPLVCNTMWAITDFTEKNGATRLVPGSHVFPEFPPPVGVDTVAAEMPRGSVLVYNGSLWHGGGRNETDRRRIGIAMNYCAGFVRQQENQQLGIPRELVKTFPRRLQDLVGYGVYNGLIGHIDKRSPRRLLEADDGGYRAFEWELGKRG